jgi:hypothetical protein
MRVRDGCSHRPERAVAKVQIGDLDVRRVHELDEVTAGHSLISTSARVPCDACIATQSHVRRAEVHGCCSECAHVRARVFARDESE